MIDSSTSVNTRTTSIKGSLDTNVSSSSSNTGSTHQAAKFDLFWYIQSHDWHYCIPHVGVCVCACACACVRGVRVYGVYVMCGT